MAMVNLQTGFELVHAVYDYCDEPRIGVADYAGAPHWFENIFDEREDDFSDDYWLTPLSADAFAAVKEQSGIFEKWRQAFDRGEVELSTHPALPQDAKEYEKLKARIRTEITGKANQRLKVRGKFSLVGPSAQSRQLSTFQVRWSS
jgi:hypothetical protein